MDDRQKYMGNVENTLKRYNQKLDKISKAASSYPSAERDSIHAELENVKDKFKDADKMYQDLKASTAENWDKLKDTSAEVMNALKDSFQEFSGYISLDQLNHMKDEVIDYGQEKLDYISNCVRRKPFTAACWAMAIGFVLGKMMTGSKK